MSGGWRSPLWLVVGIVLIGGLGKALATTITIVKADTLQLRRVKLPDGHSQNLIVITGHPAEIRFGGNTVIAPEVDFNETTRQLTLVGPGEFIGQASSSVTAGLSSLGTTTPSATTATANSPANIQEKTVLRGHHLVLNLNTMALRGNDVFISSGSLEIRGASAEQLPGQIQISGGFFTPCGRCGQTPDDYAFQADRITLYPGNRLIGYDTTVLLAGQPVAYLPVVVLLLNNPARQPKLTLSNDPVDGFTVALDLPFVSGNATYGFTLLRYYQNRSPSLGLGIQLNSDQVLGQPGSLSLYALATPLPVGSSGYSLDYALSLSGETPLLGTTVSFQLSADRNDTQTAATLSSTEPNQVGALNPSTAGLTQLNFSASGSWPGLSAQLNYVGEINTNPALVPPPEVLKLPELQLSTQTFTFGHLSAQFGATIGDYVAPVNPLDRQARLLGSTVSDGRLLVSDQISDSSVPWKGGLFSLSNNFTGQYYTDGQRAVNWTIQASASHTFSIGNTISLSYAFTRIQGQSPFAFDSLIGQSNQQVLTFGVTLRPLPSLNLSATLPDTLQGQTSPAVFGAQFASGSLSASFNLQQDIATNSLGGWTLSAASSGQGPSFSLSTGFSGQTRLYNPLSLTLGDSDYHHNTNVSLGLLYDLNAETLTSLSGTLNATTQTSSGAAGWGLSLQESYSFGAAQLSGTWTVSHSGLSFGISHTLTLGAVTGSFPASSSLTFSLADGLTGSPLSWSVQYGGAYDLQQGAWINPTLSASLQATRSAQQLSAQVVFNAPGPSQPSFELETTQVSAQWDLTPWLALQGSASFQRGSLGTPDTLSFSPFGITLALGKDANGLPGAYVTTLLQQNFFFQAGQDFQQQVLPIFFVTINQCCWALQVEVNPLSNFAQVSFVLPNGQLQPIAGFGQGAGGLQFPGLSGLQSP